MKLLHFDDFKLGVLKGDAVVDVSAEVKEIAHSGPGDLMNGLIEHWGSYKSRLEAAVVSMTEAAKAGDARAAVAADAAFHLAIVATTSSRRLRSAAEAALRELRIVLAVADRVACDLDDLAADHAALLEVLVHAPAPSARAALLDHLRRGESRALAVTHGA